MSGVVILAPIVITTAWPLMVTAATAVMVALGYTAVSAMAEEEVETEVESSVEIELTNQQEVGQVMGREERLVFAKDGITVIFSKDVRGRLKVCVEGDAYSKAELKALGKELAGRVIQQYAYQRIVSEIQQKSGMSMVEQSVDEDETIRIKLRSWEE